MSAAVSRVEGTLTLEDGRTVHFLLSPEGSSRWGAELRTLGDSVDACDAMSAGLDLAELWVEVSR